MLNTLNNKELKNSIIKILMLYIGTSSIFLIILFFMIYIKEINFLRINQMVQLKEAELFIGSLIVDSIDKESKTINKIELKNELEKLDSSLHFMILDSNEILYSNVKFEDEVFKHFTSTNQNAFFKKDNYIFISFGMDRSLDHLAFKAPKPESNEINFSEKIIEKNMRSMQKMLRKMELKIIVQGINVDNKIIPLLYKKDNKKDFFKQTKLDIEKEKQKLKIQMILLFLFSIIIISIIAYFLVKLSLKPIYNRFNLLTEFIKDSTHEINTPLSIILLSIQTIDEKNLNETNKKKFFHIQLAAKNLTLLYQNLIHFNFQKNVESKNILLKEAIEKRLIFFAPLLEQMNIKVTNNLDSSYITINENALYILLDNLLSNAIKYNKQNGLINISLLHNKLIIENTGEAIQDIESIFNRYERKNNNKGGFGIGLSIVKQIARKYKLNISVETETINNENINKFCIEY